MTGLKLNFFSSIKSEVYFMRNSESDESRRVPLKEAELAKRNNPHQKMRVVFVWQLK